MVLRVESFDRACGLLLAFIFGFSAGVAVTGWDWFPTESWSDIAHVPRTGLNYVVLLLPGLSLLVYSILRRRLWRGGEDAEDE